MIEKARKKIREKISVLALFLVSLLIPLIASHRGLCKGSCTSCGLCVLVIPIALLLSVSTGVKQRLKSLTWKR